MSIHLWFLLQLLFSVVTCFPTNSKVEIRNNQGDSRFNTSQILGFMRKFGYLNSSSTASTSEMIIHEDAMVDAVKNMQKYGGLNESGVLDSATLKLLTTPRCGLPDIPRRNRHKRFVLGSNGWQKRRITYYISNWSPKVGEEKVVEGMAHAFELWSKYSGLRFQRVRHPNADIIVVHSSPFLYRPQGFY